MAILKFYLKTKATKEYKMADRASLMYAIQQGGRLKNAADRPVGEVKE
jgi:hypothetical protein